MGSPRQIGCAGPYDIYKMIGRRENHVVVSFESAPHYIVPTQNYRELGRTISGIYQSHHRYTGAGAYLALVEVVIPGPPIPQPRARARAIRMPDGRHRGAVYLPKKHDVHKWKKRTRDTVMGSIKTTRQFDHWKWPMADQPFAVELCFVTGRGSKRRTFEKGYIPATRHNSGDLDNLVKPVLDSLNGHLWKDDSQVVYLSTMKREAQKGERTHTVMRVYLWLPPVEECRWRPVEEEMQYRGRRLFE